MSAIEDERTQERLAQAFPVGAVVLLTVGLVLAALNGVCMKMLAGVLPALFIVWGRNVAYLALMLPFALARHGAGAFLPPRPRLQVLRVLLLFASTILFIWGLEGLPLADAVAIVYVYPFVLSALAPALLKEEVNAAAWVGVVGGFLGVLVVMRPEFGHIGLHALLTLASGVLLGIQLLLTRLIVRSASPLITSTYTALMLVLLASPLLPFSWRTIGALEAALLLALGALTAVSQWFSLVAFSRAPASLLAPFSYAEIPAAVLYGFVFFGDVPDLASWLGIAVIIASGVVVARAPQIAAAVARRRPPSP